MLQIILNSVSEWLKGMFDSSNQTTTINVKIPANYTLEVFKKKSQYFNSSEKDDKVSIDMFIEALKKEANNTLLIRNDGVEIKIYEIINWTRYSLEMGEDIFTTAHLANQDLKCHRTRDWFLWSAMLGSDDTRLKRILSKGMAENHCHLGAAGPCFELNWITLMNRLDSHNQISKQRKKLGLPEDYTEEELKELLNLASLLRLYLYQEITDKNLKDDTALVSNCLQMILKNAYVMKSEIQSMITTYSSLYSPELKVADVQGRFDYAMPKKYSKWQEEPYFVLGGERYLMYHCFKRIYETKESDRFLRYFLAYLGIKHRVRNLFVQQHGMSGFQNFADHQGRKAVFLNNDLVKRLHYRVPIIAYGNDNSIKSFEAREPFSKKPISMVLDSYHKITQRNQSYTDRFIKGEDMEFIPGLHFVMAFKKKAYKLHKSDMVERLRCRHADKRLEVKKEAKSLENYFSGYKIYKRYPITGIDALSAELECEPEVFAQAYRYLRGECNKYHKTLLDTEDNGHRFRATFHVGEMFLDIVNGLRTIFEAVKFLRLKRGDRIGHGMVLGVNPEDFYKSKPYIYLRQQDYLDNIVWALHMINTYSLNVHHALQGKLKTEYHKYYYELYFEKYKDNGSNLLNKVVEHETYYWAYKLRADNPKHYLDIDKKNTKPRPLCAWDRYDFCHKRVEDGLTKIPKTVLKLIQKYHYDPQTKRKGRKVIRIPIDNEYINLATLIQREMRIMIAERGIGIECNPTSNLRIGPFDRYDDHPIFNMFAIDEKFKNDFDKNLFVSINTDDPSVFNTCLENEYAVLLATLQNQKDEHGNRKYTDTEIYEWLDRVREMGLNQSFLN